MKKFLIAVMGAVLVFGSAMYAQDVVTGAKDLGKDVDKGAKKAAKDTEKAADKTADRFDFPDDHRRPDTAGLRARCGDPSDPQIGKDVPTQIAYCIFPDPASINVDGEFG